MASFDRKLLSHDHTHALLCSSSRKRWLRLTFNKLRRSEQSTQNLRSYQTDWYTESDESSHSDQSELIKAIRSNFLFIRGMNIRNRAKCVRKSHEIHNATSMRQIMRCNVSLAVDWRHKQCIEGTNSVWKVRPDTWVVPSSGSRLWI